MLYLWLLQACFLPRNPLPDDTVSPIDEPTRPSIVWYQARCDDNEDQWTIEIDADAWTGGGHLAWTVDGDYLELHDVHTQSVERDGSAETLRLRLNVVDDFREYEPGKNTWFACSVTPFQVFELDGSDGTRTDCIETGPEVEVPEDFERCERRWDTGATDE